MLDLIKGAWNSLSKRGRGVVSVVLIVVVAALLAYTMFLGYDWSWVKDMY